MFLISLIVYPIPSGCRYDKQLKFFKILLTEKYGMRLQAKKLSKNYTEFMFYKSISKFLT